LASVGRAGGGCTPSDTYWRVHTARVQPKGLALTTRGDARSGAALISAGPSKWPFLGARPFGVGRACGRRLHTVWHALDTRWRLHTARFCAAHGLSPQSQLEETLDRSRAHNPAGPSKWPFLGARPFQLASVGRAGAGGKLRGTHWGVRTARVQPMGSALTARGDARSGPARISSGPL